MTKLSEAKDNYLAELGGLVVTVEGTKHPVQFPRMAEWQPVEAVPDLWMRPIPVPDCPHSDYILNRGEVGVHAEQVSIPQAAQLTVLSGALLWRQGAQERQHLAPGQTVWLEPYELHSYLFLDYTVVMVVITPPFAHYMPRPHAD